jgi:hypothetical protein
MVKEVAGGLVVHGMCGGRLMTLGRHARDRAKEAVEAAWRDECGRHGAEQRVREKQP